MNRKYQKALDGIHQSCPSGTEHPNDKERIISIFEALMNSGHFLPDSNEISEHLESAGWDEEKSGDVQVIYDILAARRQPLSGWSKEFLEEVLSA